MALVADVKTVGKVDGISCIMVQKRRTNPEDNPFIGLKACINNRLVKFKRADEQNVARLELVTLPFNLIFHLTADKEINFIKIMVMECNRTRLAVKVVEDFKRVFLHLLTGIEPFDKFFHPNVLLNIIVQQDLQC